MSGSPELKRATAKMAANEPLYSEATCTDDPYYQGSEDEDYLDPQTRRLRYEEAGQRFLDGKVPFLLSASLRGPFDQESGWCNPWRSQQRCESGRLSQFVCESEQREKTQLLREQEPAADDLDCHLPSPESLKQAPASESHPYLEQDELAMVQTWRENIHVPPLSQDPFWASRSQTGVSATKRKAKESAWLRRVADKRRRTQASGQGLSDSPLSSSQPDSLSSPAARTHATARASSERKGYSIGSALKSRPAQWSQVKHESNDNKNDEFMGNTPDAASASVSSRNKRSSPRQDARGSASLHVSGTINELSQNEEAAATLSSPVSQRYGPNRASGVATGEMPNAFPTSKSSPSKRSWRSVEDEGQGDTSTTDADGQRDDELAMDLDEHSAPFQTQQDQSFCFKMRCALNEHANQARPDEPSHPASSPNISRQTPLSDAQVAEGRSSQTADEIGPLPDESDAHEYDETESVPILEDLDEHQVQPLVHHSNGGDQGPAGHATQIDQHVVCEDAQDMPDIARQAIEAVLPVQTGLEYSSQAIGSLGEAQLVAQPLPMDTCPPFPSICRDAAPEDGNAETHHSMAQNDTTSTSNMKNETLVPAALPQRTDAGSSPTAGPSLRHTMPRQEADVAPSVEVQRSRQDASNPEEKGNHAMQARLSSPAEGARSDFSLRNILHKFSPLSPWSRYSRPGPHPVPSPMDSTPRSARPEEIDAGVSDTPRQGVGESNGVTPFPSAPGDEQEATLPNELVEFAAVDAASEQGRVANVGAAGQGMETNQADPSERLDETWIAASQQSPWTRAEPSERKGRTVGSMHDGQGSPSLSSQGGTASQVERRPEAQSPWSREAELAATAVTELGAAVDADGGDGMAGNSSNPQPQSQPRPSTPEPQFLVKTFASFLSPSPKRSHGQRARPSVRIGESGGHPSAMKNS